MAEASVKERVNHTVYYIKEIWSPETGTDSVFFGLFFFDFTLIIIITSCPNGDFAVTAFFFFCRITLSALLSSGCSLPKLFPLFLSLGWFSG